MKSGKEEHIEAIKESLATAYHEKGKGDVDELWQMRVMSHIRSLEPLHSKVSYSEVFGKLVWRFAPVLCVLILILLACIIQLDFISDYEIAEMFMEDPVDFTLFQSFET